jgi:CDP-diacylglycerol--glycerol-3-phosphate 3-phosphatidyltransferase
MLATLQEYIRARAAVVGVNEIGVVSISERPTRIIIVSVFLGLSVWAPYSIATQTWAWIGLLAAALVGAVGVLQVSYTVGRRLSGSGSAA